MACPVSPAIPYHSWRYGSQRTNCIGCPHFGESRLKKIAAKGGGPRRSHPSEDVDWGSPFWPIHFMYYCSKNVILLSSPSSFFLSYKLPRYIKKWQKISHREMCDIIGDLVMKSSTVHLRSCNWHCWVYINHGERVVGFCGVSRLLSNYQTAAGATDPKEQTALAVRILGSHV